MTRPERRHVARLATAYTQVRDLGRVYAGLHQPGAEPMRQAVGLVASALALELSARLVGEPGEERWLERFEEGLNR